MNEEVLKIQVKNVYGNETIYPVNETAKIFAKIAGTKTLTRETINQAKELGYQVQLDTVHMQMVLEGVL